LPPGDPHRDMAQQFYVETESKDDVSSVAKRIDETFDNSPYPTKSEPEQAFFLSFVALLGNLKLFLAAICGAVTFTILLVSANMLSMAVRERTREMGVLKTLGFSRGEIVGMVVSEATLVSLTGGVLGCAFATALCGALEAALKHASGFASVIKGVSLSPLIATLTLIMALLIGLTSSLAPALITARSSILDDLKFRG